MIYLKILLLDIVVILSATGQAVILLSVFNRVGVGLGLSSDRDLHRAEYLCIIHSEWDIITYHKPEVSIDSVWSSSGAGHSHHQLIIEKMRHFTSIGRAGTAGLLLYSMFFHKGTVCYMCEKSGLILTQVSELESALFSKYANTYKEFPSGPLWLF